MAPRSPQPPFGDVARAILCRAVSAEREAAISNRSTCLSLLKDFGGNDYPEIALLADCVDLGLAGRLSEMQSRDFEPEVLRSMAAALQARRFYAEDMCRWAIESWALAFGLISGPPCVLHCSGFQSESRCSHSKSGCSSSATGARAGRGGPIGSPEWFGKCFGRHLPQEAVDASGDPRQQTSPRSKQSHADWLDA